MFSVCLCPFQNRAAQVSPEHRPTLFQAGVTHHLAWVLGGWRMRWLVPSSEPRGTTLWFDTAPWCRPSWRMNVRQEVRVFVCVTNGVLVAEKYVSVLTEWKAENVAWIFYHCCGLSLADLFLLLRSGGDSHNIRNTFSSYFCKVLQTWILSVFKTPAFQKNHPTKEKATLKAPNVSSELKYNRNTHFMWPLQCKLYQNTIWWWCLTNK